MLWARTRALRVADSPMQSNTLLVLALVLATGCARNASESEATGSASAHAANGAEARAPAAAARAAGTPLVFEPPPDWVVETPTSEVRRAQYRLPRSAGDAEDGECVVYFFGEMGGGGVEANLARWASQFEQPDGRDSMAVLVRSERQVAGMPVHEAQLAGTYVAETAPGSGERVNEPGFALRAAIIDSDHGSYYVKLVGPATTVAQHDGAFREFIGRVR